MLGRVTRERINNISDKVRNFVARGYVNAKHTLGKMDRTVQTAKRIFETTAPLLEAYHPETRSITRDIKTNINRYDNFRKLATETDKTVGHLFA